MEPEFSLSAETPRASKTTINIAGLRVYVYGKDELTTYNTNHPTEFGVLYLAHGRTRNYRDTEEIAHEVLHQYRNDARPKKVELIVVTFDMRNHGDREINAKANQGWQQGNIQHGQDMFSSVSGSAHDFQLVFDYLPTYLPGISRSYNVMSGISLGGHTTWRIAVSEAAAQGQVHGLIPIIGSPHLTALLLDRLRVGTSNLNTAAEDLYKVPYGQLSPFMTEDQRQRWPQTLSELVSRLDRETNENFPQDIPMLIQNGELDTSVPDKFTSPWVQKRKAEGYTNIEYFVQGNTGHTCTKEMVANISNFLVKLFAV